MNMLLDFWKRWRAWGRHRAALVPFPDPAELARRKLAARPDDGTIIAFYTPGGIYESEKDRLLRSAALLGVKAIATSVTSAGSWVRNAGLKAGFLLEQREKLRGPLLYLDVDAVLHRNPWSFLHGIQCDMAAYYVAADINAGSNEELVSATLLLNDTPATMEILRRWRDRCAADPEMWDQHALQEVLAEDARSASPLFYIARLPVSCCWIFDKVEDKTASREIYIEQLQASREVVKDPLHPKVSRRLVRRRDRVATIERILFETDRTRSTA